MQCALLAYKAVKGIDAPDMKLTFIQSDT